VQFHNPGYVSGDPRVQPAAGARSQELRDQVDVLIVGAGPAGLIAAAQLAQFPNITTRIVERRNGRLEVGQADGIQARSVETFQAFGFANRMIEEAYQINRVEHRARLTIRNASTSGEAMSTQPTPRHRGPIRTPVAVATILITALALALAAPVAEASAATPHAVALRARAGITAINPPPSSPVHSGDHAAVAIGPTLSGDVFNGPTLIITSPSPVVGTVVGSA
jgi:threonine dehydrogenase-like Zn-dependent dehydrogenase